VHHHYLRRRARAIEFYSLLAAAICATSRSFSSFAAFAGRFERESGHPDQPGEDRGRRRTGIVMLGISMHADELLFHAGAATSVTLPLLEGDDEVRALALRMLSPNMRRC
jgi:hypothetical protein